MGVIAMHHPSAVPLAAAILVLACGSPTPEPAVQRAPDPPVQPSTPRVVQQPDPGLLAHAVKEAEAAIEVAGNPGWYLQKQVNRNRYNYMIPLEAAKAAYDSAPEATREAYAASAAAYTAADEFNKLEYGTDAQVVGRRKSQRDAAFRAARDAWKQHQ